MWKGLVVPLDGSPRAEQALPYATALAHVSGARLTLLYARRTAELPEEGTPDLDAVAARLRAEGIDVDTLVCHAPNADDTGRAIVDAAVELGAGLIMMATHGRGGLGQMLYGSVANQVLQQAALPVLLIPPNCERSWSVGQPLRILVPLDGSETAEAILAPLQQLIWTVSVELILLRVAETFEFKPHGDECIRCRLARERGEEPDVEPARARRYINDVEDRLRAAGVPVEAQVEFGGTASTITRIAQERDVDLIAMTTRGRGSLARLVLGSVAADTLRQATVPMLLGRPEAVRQAALAVTEVVSARAPSRPRGPIRVKDIMSRTVVTVGPESTLEEIARLMLYEGVGSLLVVDAKSHLRGIVTDSDFCGKEYNVPLSDFKMPRVFGQWLPKQGVEAIYQAARTMLVRDIMSTPVTTAIEDEPISVAVRRMIESDVRQMPVVKGEMPVGMVTRHDLLWLVAEGSVNR